MKIKLDENIPLRIKTALTDLGHDVDTVVEEGARGASDQMIWKIAQEAGRFLITQDMDFSDIHRFTPGTHCGLLIVRLRTPGRENLYQRVKQVFEEENVELWGRCLVIVSDVKIRIQRPKI